MVNAIYKQESDNSCFYINIPVSYNSSGLLLYLCYGLSSYTLQIHGISELEG